MNRKKCKRCGHREDYCVCEEGPVFAGPQAEPVINDGPHKGLPLRLKCMEDGCTRRWTISHEFGANARGWCRWHYPYSPEALTEDQYREQEERRKDPAERLADLIERDRNEGL